MDRLETEDQQLESLKRWWNANGKSLLLGGGLAVLAVLGWRYWDQQQRVTAEHASAAYHNLLSRMASGDVSGAQERGAQIINEFGGTSYGELTALVLAKLKADEGDLQASRTYLQTVVDKSTDPGLQHVARLRLARLMIAEDQVDQALAMLQVDDKGSFMHIYTELQGDAYLAQGNNQQAVSAYQNALSQIPERLSKNQLQAKLDDLGAGETL